MQSPGPCAPVESALGPQHSPLEEPLNPTPQPCPIPEAPFWVPRRARLPWGLEAEGVGLRRLGKVGSRPACGEDLSCRTKWGFAAQRRLMR